MHKRHRQLPTLPDRNDRWPTRRFQDGYEGSGTWIGALHADDADESPEHRAQDVVDFLGCVGFDRRARRERFWPAYPNRPFVGGVKRRNLEARLRALWDAMAGPDRVERLKPILRTIQPVWRARAIAILPLEPRERAALRGVQAAIPVERLTPHTAPLHCGHRINLTVRKDLIDGRAPWDLCPSCRAGYRRRGGRPR